MKKRAVNKGRTQIFHSEVGKQVRNKVKKILNQPISELAYRELQNFPVWRVLFDITSSDVA